MKKNSRKTFRGLALGIVQTGNVPGTIKVVASAPGLKDAAVEISSQKDPAPVKTIEDFAKTK